MRIVEALIYEGSDDGFSSVAPPGHKNLGRDAADRCAGGRGIFVALRLHHAGLRDHPRVWTCGSGGFRNRRARDAGCFSARGGAQLCCFTCSGTELRQTSCRSSPAFRLFGDWHRVTDDAGAHVNRVFRAGDIDSRFLTRSTCDCFWRRIPSDRLIEFHIGGDCRRYRFSRRI